MWLCMLVYARLGRNWLACNVTGAHFPDPATPLFHTNAANVPGILTPCPSNASSLFVGVLGLISVPLGPLVAPGHTWVQRTSRTPIAHFPGCSSKGKRMGPMLGQRNVLFATPTLTFCTDAMWRSTAHREANWSRIVNQQYTIMHWVHDHNTMHPAVLLTNAYHRSQGPKFCCCKPLLV